MTNVNRNKRKKLIAGLKADVNTDFSEIEWQNVLDERKQKQSIIEKEESHDSDNMIISEDESEIKEKKLSSEQIYMEKLFGFCNFYSTKSRGHKTKVPGAAGAARIVTQRKYRQYMNRSGGFNKYLDKVY